MKNTFLALVAACNLAGHTEAQTAGTLDLAFGNAGKATTAIGPNDASAHGIAVQADGKILVAGDTYTNNTLLEDFALARYLPDGTLDNSFGTNGLVVTDIQQNSDAAKAVAVQSDGKILVAGHAHNGSNYDFAIARYLANGTLDNSFGANGKVIKNFGSTDFGLAMALLPDGKLLVAGRSYNGTNGDFALLKLNSNGSFDTNFGTAGALRADLFGEEESANAIAVQPDGKIVAVGDRYANNVSIFAAARFQPDGALDISFGNSGKVSHAIGTLSDVAYAVALQPDGKILAAGVSNTLAISDFALARYLPNGTLDNTFSDDGQLTTNIAVNGGDYAQAVAIQPDGKILVAGAAAGNNSIADFALARYLPDGTLDATFGSAGIGLADFMTSKDVANAMLLHQGKILLAGYSDKNAQSSFAIARFSSDFSVGTQESAFVSLQIYPNPALDFLNIKIPNAGAGCFVRVLSTVGKVVIEMPVLEEALQINVANWPSGMYFLECQTTERGRALGKFLVK
jgi:uncharacterized delta-60 repeat protein